MKKHRQITTYREELFDLSLFRITKNKLDKFTYHYLRKRIQEPLWRGIGFKKARLLWKAIQKWGYDNAKN